MNRKESIGASFFRLSTQTRRDAQKFESIRIRFEYLLQKANPERSSPKTNSHNSFNKLQDSHHRWSWPTA